VGNSVSRREIPVETGARLLLTRPRRVLRARYTIIDDEKDGH
jgi:hypothetical protein